MSVSQNDWKLPRSIQTQLKTEAGFFQWLADNLPSGTGGTGGTAGTSGTSGTGGSGTSGTSGTSGSGTSGTSGVDSSQILTIGMSSTVAITTGIKSQAKVISPYTGTISGWKLISEPACTAVIDILKNTVTPSGVDTITASAKPSLTAADINSSSTLTGWTTSVNEGDIIMLEVESNDVATYLSLQLKIV